MTPTTQAPRRVALVVGSATILLLGYAGPAAADVPDGWSNPPSVSVLHFLLLFVGIPVLITLCILAGVYLPGIVRGESVAPAGVRSEPQWFGGRRDTAQLESTPAARGDESASGEATDRGTGGAGGTW